MNYEESPQEGAHVGHQGPWENDDLRLKVRLQAAIVAALANQAGEQEDPTHPSRAAWDAWGEAEYDAAFGEWADKHWKAEARTFDETDPLKILEDLNNSKETKH